MVRAPELDVASLAPMLPITLVASKTVEALGLLDTGAAVNVLPHAAGVELGLDWKTRRYPWALPFETSGVPERHHSPLSLYRSLAG